MNDEKWLDKFYSDFETGLGNYTRPKDWKTRLERLKKRTRKPMINQIEGKRNEQDNT